MFVSIFVQWEFSGEIYLEKNKKYRAGLLIHKQALGNTAFEQGTAHLLSSLDLDTLSVPYDEYRVSSK